MKLGSTDISKVYLGSTEVSKAYLGSVLVHGSESPVLPYDAEVEFLESTGTQYIQTGVAPTSTLKTEIEFSLVNGFTFGNTKFLFGEFISNSTSYSVALSSDTAIRVPNRGNMTNLTCSSIGLTKHTISYKFGEIYYDGTLLGTQSGLADSNSSNIRIFGRKSGNLTGNLRIYSLKITDGNTTLIDYIPVRVGQVGYMYDKVSGNLFGNAGTGAFTYGNDVNT